MERFTNETFIKNENGEMVLIHSEIVEVQLPTEEELIAEKEAELLRIYEEIQQLKNK